MFNLDLLVSSSSKSTRGQNVLNSTLLTVLSRMESSLSMPSVFIHVCGNVAEIKYLHPRKTLADQYILMRILNISETGVHRCGNPFLYIVVGNILTPIIENGV